MQFLNSDSKATSSLKRGLCTCLQRRPAPRKCSLPRNKELKQQQLKKKERMNYWTPSERASERTDNNENEREELMRMTTRMSTNSVPNAWEITSKTREEVRTIKRSYTRNSISETITFSINQHKTVESTLSDSCKQSLAKKKRREREREKKGTWDTRGRWGGGRTKKKERRVKSRERDRTRERKGEIIYIYNMRVFSKDSLWPGGWGREAGKGWGAEGSRVIPHRTDPHLPGCGRAVRGEGETPELVTVQKRSPTLGSFGKNEVGLS